MPKVYIASKTKYADLWQSLWETHPNLHITSRWIWAMGQLPESPINAKRFWQDDLRDIADCQVLICYSGNYHEQLRGALVEVGMALALGKRVFCVGENPCFGTWQHHPLVKAFRTVDDALGQAGAL